MVSGIGGLSGVVDREGWGMGVEVEKDSSCSVESAGRLMGLDDELAPDSEGNNGRESKQEMTSIGNRSCSCDLRVRR